MPFDSVHKDALIALLKEHYQVSEEPRILESYLEAGHQETNVPGSKKFMIQIFVPWRGKPANWFCIVPNLSQQSIDGAYLQFHDSMVKLLRNGRDPFKG